MGPSYFDFPAAHPLRRLAAVAVRSVRFPLRLAPPGKRSATHAVAVVLILVPLLICDRATAASFDCCHAHSRVEHLICRNQGLSRLDDTMGSLYEAIESETAGVDGDTGAVLNPIGDEQAIWLEQVRNKCKTSTCLERVYLERIRQMKIDWKDALP